MSVLAHGGAEVINTWGFAYVGGIIGLFSMSLVFVKARVNARSGRHPSNWLVQSLASFGRPVIVVGGVCGVSLGLGIAGLLGTIFVDDEDVDGVVAQLCELGRSAPGELPSDLHDDVVHVIEDGELRAAAVAHGDLHAVAGSLDVSAEDWVESIDRLSAALVDGRVAMTCEDTSGTD